MPGMVFRRLIAVFPLFLAACSHKAATETTTTLAPSDLRTGPAVVGADAGLEVAWFVTSADEQTLGAILGKYAGNLVPLSSEQQALWQAHGLRMVSIPLEDVDAVTGELKTSGQSQRQWLGQAYSWTEVVRGPEMPGGRTIALDAERIRLGPGALRLLIRDWIEPAPATSESAPPVAMLRVEIVPQHEDNRARALRADPLGLTPPRIAPEEQGLLFSRLYARLSVPSGNAYLIIPERPGVEWKVVEVDEIESDAPADELVIEEPATERATPKVGEVIRGGDKSRTGTVHATTPIKPRTTQQSGPPAPLIQTVGEAMLMRPANTDPDAPVSKPARAVVVLVPRVPKEFRLIDRPARPQPPSAASARP